MQKAPKPSRGPSLVVPSLLLAALLFFFAAVVAGVLLTSQREETPTEETDEPVVDAPQEEAGNWPIFITTMTHLEGNWTEAATNEEYFNRQADLVRHGMDLAEEYGATLTVESEIPMAEGMLAFGDNLLQEVLDRGHGAGTHCDINPRTRYTVSEMVEQFAARKTLVDSLIGASENLGCSGGGTDGDWYKGAVGAGFSYLNGLVGFHYLALPESERPDGWDSRAIQKEFYHYPAPQDWEKYFHPFLVSKLGFDEDPNGDLLLTEGALGNVTGLAELGDWTLTSSVRCIDSSCTFDADDAAAAVAFIQEFAANDDRSRPSKITFYMPSNAFEDVDDEAMRAFFAAMQELVDTGVVQWASQRQVYDTVMEYYAQQ